MTNQDQAGRERRYPRIRAEHPVLVKELESAVLDEVARTQVLGPGGCMFVHAEPIGEGVSVRLRIAVDGKAVEAVGRVAYENLREDRTYEIGVEFLSIGDADRAILEKLFE